RTGEHRRLPARSLFVFTGADPHTEWLTGTLALDSRGFILTGPEAQEACTTPETWQSRGRTCMSLETSLPGVFAVGDVRSGSVKRVASAAGEGSMSIHYIHRHLGHSAVPGTTGTSAVAGHSDASPHTRHKESAWLA
ncbi:cyclic nucleotide-binding protein, partial [Streptomyces sp. NPDC046859]